MSVLRALRTRLDRETASELFAACARKSYEQVELLLAARFPKPDVRDLIRRLPAPAEVTPDIGSPKSETRQVGEKPSPSKLTVTPDLGRGEAVKPLSVDRFSVNFTADSEFRELLEEVRELLSHAEPKGDLLNVMRRGLQALRADLLKKRFGMGRKPRRVQLRRSQASATTQRSSSKQSRHVPAAVAREVYARDQGRCTFCSDGGRRCAERRLLQLDHVRPFAEGGEATVENLRLRCRAHSLHAATVHFGREYVRAAVRARAGSNGGQRAAQCEDGTREPAARSEVRFGP